MEPPIVIAKHSITLPPNTLDEMLSYIRFFIYQQQVRLSNRSSQYRVQPAEDAATVQQELDRAEALAKAIEPAQGHVVRIYDLNFVAIAEALRQARLQLEVEQIENMYSLKVVLHCLMTMLREHNTRFDQEKFIQYINERN